MNKRLISILLCVVMLFGTIAMAPVSWLPETHAATVSQNNIVARANYLYESTWVCQKTVTGWRGSYTFYQGNTYRIPYGQPVYAGAYVGFGVSVDDYLAAAANANSIFYTSKSNYAGKTSTYYATDCSAFVSWCWGIGRQTTATIPNVSTYIGSASQSNIVNYLQVGDCLNSNSAGHVVLVTGLTYSGGTLTRIEITEQTPPQLKRSYFTPAQLAASYSASYGIYRYTGTVPAAPVATNGNTTSFGVEVSAKLKRWIFDPVFYAEKYPELVTAIGTDANLLYNHFLNYGITEGRQASPLFNIKYYLNQNTDLQGIYGADYEAAFEHFVVFGQYESSRVYSKQLSAIRNVIFDADFYRAMYPAKTESFGNDVGRLFANFIKTGLSEGRTASPVFDISTYISGNKDLRTVYADDYYGAMRHFIANGQNESRVTSPIFDTDYYTGRYANAAGLTTLAAMEQFLDTGMGKARQGNASFDPKFYYFANEAALKDYTQSTAYIHYLVEGKTAGLQVVPYGYFPEDVADVGTNFIASLTNLKSGKNWNVTGSSVTISPAADSETQKWKFIRQEDGSYEIWNVGSELVLTATDNGSSAGMVCLSQDADQTTQRWYIYEVDGYYTFRTACNNYITISLTDGSTADGNTVEMAYYRDNEAQKYTISVLIADTQIENCDHSYVGMVTQEPTCTTDGERTCTCTGCGDSYTEVVAATGHSNEAVVTEPTCTEGGFTTHTCMDCGDTYSDQNTSATGHIWMDAACTEPKTCAACGTTEGDFAGHSFEATITPSTCLESGSTIFTCTNCGLSYEDYIELPTGHRFEPLVSAPDYDACGYTTYLCTDCGFSYIDDIITPTGYSVAVAARAVDCDACSVSSISRVSRLPSRSTGSTGYDRGYSGAMAGDGKIYAHGLDVSSWQGESLNFQNFKNAGYDYVILRCGTTKGKDTCFEINYTKAKNAGLDVGAYYYSYATSVAGAKADAANMISWMQGKSFEYPIYFDYEDSSQSGIDDATAANICYGFLDTMRDAGYLVGLYSMASWLEKSWVTTSGIRGKYEGWVAHYPSTASNTGITSTVYQKYHATYSSRYGMYQYSSSTYVNGAGPFDANVCYKDYPAIVETYGFNGYSGGTNLKSVVFDPVYYGEKYPELVAAIGSDATVLYDHFLKYGIKEGRQASPNFDVSYYLANNAHVQTAIGSTTDYVAAYEYFLEKGYKKAAKTAQCADLGEQFYAKIRFKSSKNWPWMARMLLFIPTVMRRSRSGSLPARAMAATSSSTPGTV